MEEEVREIALPGEIIAKGSEWKAGIGVYKEGEDIFSMYLGVKKVKGNYVNVIPLSGRYIPKRDDIIVGKVVDIGPSNWILDINSPYQAFLYVSEVPWKIEFGETAKYIDIGDCLIVKVSGIDETMRVQVSMSEPPLKKITSGIIIEIAQTKVPRIIGRGGSMISILKKETNCRIFVGQNGRIWLEGKPEDISIATIAIKKIEKEAHQLGLTDTITKFFEQVRMDKHDKTIG